MTKDIQEGILTVDLEDWYHANYDEVNPSSWDRLESRVVEHTNVLLEIFEQHQCKATFFVLGHVAEQQPDLIRRIHEKGHEIACHGHRHLKISDLGPTGFLEDLRQAKVAIDRACGIAPCGFRAPSWSLSPPRWPPDQEDLWPLRILAEEGFTYDASLFPFKTFLYGVDAAPTIPHRIPLNGQGEIYELPSSVVSILGKSWPFSGGFYFRVLPLGASVRFGRRFIREHACPFMYYIHPREVCPEQPRLRLGLRDHFIHYVNLKRNRSKLDKMLRAFRFGTAAAFLRDHGARIRPLEMADRTDGSLEHEGAS